MADSARIGYPEPKHGIVAAIVMANLVRQIGRKAAFELVALGEPVDAHHALELGMVNPRGSRGRGDGARAVPGGEAGGGEAPGDGRDEAAFHEVADLPLAAALERGRDTNKRMRNFAQLGKE